MESKAGPFPPRSLFFYPDQPPLGDILEEIRRYAGWTLSSSPETADWCVLYRDATWVTLPEDDPYAAIAPTWINGRCRDISKRTVQRVFAEVFGYPLAVDPLTHEGVCVRKNNRNAVSVNDVKDMLVLVGPIPADELSDEHVYERRIDGRVPGLGHVELYTYVVGGTVVSVLRDIRLDGMDAGRLAKMLDHSVVDARAVFSAQERTQIGGFCAAMGLDYGKLDIIRDREDRRLYILDANTTPHYNLAGWTGVTRAWFLHTVEQVVQTFPEHFPPAPSSRPSAPHEAESSRTAPHPPFHGHAANIRN